MSTDRDTDMMRAALTLAARGLGAVWPNPAVGCIIERDGRILGRGRTMQGGRPHAETMALDMAGEMARGASAHVTLEPCAHHGRTPPCADALIAAGIARVSVALTDPDPRVAGRGIARLRAAGITVGTGILADEAARVNAGFLKRVTRGLPHVTLKLATTLDGRIATSTGESRWITGPEARRRVHLMRAQSDAVLVGSGTALADDPRLDVRDLGPIGAPVRVVFDTSLRLDSGARMLSDAGSQPVWLVHGADADAEKMALLQALGAVLLGVPMVAGRIDPKAALAALAEQGITRVFCEGGGMLAAGLITAGLVDSLVVMQAGKLIGADGTPALGPLGMTSLAAAPRFDLERVEQLGADVAQYWAARV